MLLGGAYKLLHQKLGIMTDKYGPAFCIRLGSRCAFVVASKEVAKECFTTNDRALASRPTTAATKHMCYNNTVFGFAPYSPHWREMRKIVMLELLSNSQLEIIKNVQALVVNAGIRKLYSLWAANNNKLPVLVELKQWSQYITFDVIVRLVAGKCYDDGEARRCQDLISEFFRLMGVFVVSDAFPFLWWLDFQGHKRAMKKTAKDLDAVLASWLEEHRQRRISGNVKAENEQDFIDRMLSAEEKGHLSATTLAWAISLLLNNPHALKKAQEELDFQVGTQRLVNESDIKNLAYLQAVIKETLRLYPVAPLSGPREAMEDCTIAGYHVPAGTRLILNVWKIQRDPKGSKGLDKAIRF
ncbi:hypothetical protein JCGZ_04350 [Jatropha curcas]|uniref:Uncharacterized protein n=1 Tax=Jatropha curcas TaxID=180498 RepID=A0A067L1R3_JATCU|nr:hypothetical protein JCGZ_04350 [Jatropha curcas]